jgi:pimeloyl-ACP methyl ester carboxylesterase
MSTANVARDLDLLRQAVGDERLNFAGFSYGTYIAATYANLFPDRVRAMWIDGVLDPVAWATGRGNGTRIPFSSRLRSGDSSTATMHAFLRACQRVGARCGFSSAHTQRKFDRLLSRLRAHPVRADDGEVLITYADAVAGMLPPLYFQDSWPGLGQQLQDLYRLTRPGARVGDARALALRALGGEPNPGNDVDAFNAVACVDTVNPPDPFAWPRAGDLGDRRAAPFGRLWTWESDACATWGAKDTDRYLGPFRARTSAPVLIVGNRLDPATPYRGAVTLDRLMPRSRLLTVDYAGHTSLGQSRCVTRAVTRYLVDGVLPAPRAVCRSDRKPFEPVPRGARRLTRHLQRVLTASTPTPQYPI